MNEYCAIILADANFTLMSNVPIDRETKDELIAKSFPKGSNWRPYAGARSLSFFPVGRPPHDFALCYSIITENSDIPVISFIILSNCYCTMASILRRRLVGIQSAYFRRMGRFQDLNSMQARVLVANLLSLRTSTNRMTTFRLIRKKRYYRVYKSPLQWRDEVENEIVDFASENLQRIPAFKTLSLQVEDCFSIIGVVQCYSGKR